MAGDEFDADIIFVFRNFSKQIFCEKLLHFFTKFVIVPKCLRRTG